MQDAQALIEDKGVLGSRLDQLDELPVIADGLLVTYTGIQDVVDQVSMTILTAFFLISHFLC